MINQEVVDIQKKQETQKILILLNNYSNQELVQNVLEDEYRISCNKEKFTTADFDLLITDECTLNESIDKYYAMQEQVMPAFIPVLLLAGDQVYSSTNQLLELVDDILTLPTSPSVLRARVKLLVKLRTYAWRLQEEKNRFQLLAENSTDMISTHLEDGSYTYVSPSSEEVFGYKPKELVGEDAFTYIYKEDKARVAESREYTLKTGEPSKVEFRKKTKGGGYKWVESVIKSVESSVHSENTRILASTRVISDRKEYEEKLRHEITFIDTVLDFLPNIFFMVDSQLTIIRWNQNLTDRFGYSESEIQDMNPLNFFRDKDHGRVKRKIKEVFENGEAQIEADLLTKEGDAIKHSLSAQRFMIDNEVYMIGTSIDISQQHQMMKELERSNEEKQVLLKEIHHRVKNNLAVVSGMLQLQAMESEDPTLSEKLTDSQLRIQSIASVHELLYKSKSFSRIEMQQYLSELINSIHETNATYQKIDVIKNIEPVELNINQAIPCSLIANEIITNAFKHAFPDNKDGQITISLTERQGQVKLTIADNGKGVQDKIDFENPESLGIQLIDILKNQLDAKLNIRSSQGTTFHLSFQKEDRKGTGSSFIQ